MGKLDELRGVREMISFKLKFYFDETKDHASNPMDLATVDTYLQEVSLWSNKLDDGFQQITILNPSDLDDDTTAYMMLYKYVRQVSVALRDVRNKINPVTSAGIPTSTTVSTNVRLPKLEIQPFHGSYLEWTTFKDSFDAAVHSNNSLSKVGKFTYLKALLRGEAARYTAELPLTDAHYDHALKQLHDRYESKRMIRPRSRRCGALGKTIMAHLRACTIGARKQFYGVGAPAGAPRQSCAPGGCLARLYLKRGLRMIVLATLDKFCSHPRITATAKSVKAVIDSANSCIRSMELQNCDLDAFSERFCVYHITSKLYPVTKDLWEHTLMDHSLIKVTDLMEFLERHALALENSGHGSSYRSEKKTGNVYHTQADYQNCKLGCQDSHPMYKCKIFLDSSVPERWAIVKDLRLCFNCFSMGHNSFNCDSDSKCNKCKSHSGFLHGNRNQFQPLNDEDVQDAQDSN
ncbi:hypothetical protein Fcan01_00018 [Folsomia candida]|uniref:CCHC-type domain-containing protein n=1 Tax=Folsomia candida TaxID=158441 RepID=A0A226F4G6_FOLCA|nr:hypothetical protein Fcan01_00018 [Folsomia candida]